MSFIEARQESPLLIEGVQLIAKTYAELEQKRADQARLQNNGH